MILTLKDQYSLKNNQEDAITALKAHKFDDKKHKERKEERERR